MRILSVGNFGRGWDNSICDEENIAKALEELGHEVIRLQREDVSSKYIVDDFDFILVSQWDGYHKDFMKNKTIPMVYWAFDHQADGQEWHDNLVKKADLYLSKRIADSKYPNWRWLSQDFAPDFLDKHESGTKDIDILFTGSYLDWAKERNETIRAVNDNFNLVIHSVNAWPEEWNLNVQPPVMDEALPELYSRARIILSIDHTIEAGYWSDRVAQALCCESFVLHRWQPMCESVFRNHVAYFYSVEDCIEKLKNLLTPQMIAIRSETAREGHKYAQANLKVKNRVMDLLTIVGSIL